RYEQCFKSAVLPFPRYDQRRQQGAEDCHDEHNQTGNQKVTALIGLVEPEPVLHDHRPARHVLSFGYPARGPLAYRPLNITLNDPGAIGIATVSQDLHLGISVSHLAR